MRPDVLTALGRIFAEEVARATKRGAGVAGAETGLSATENTNLDVNVKTREKLRLQLAQARRRSKGGVVLADEAVKDVVRGPRFRAAGEHANGAVGTRRAAHRAVRWLTLGGGPIMLASSATVAYVLNDLDIEVWRCAAIGG